MRHRNCALAALIVARAHAAGHISEKSGGLMWPCDGGWACGYNACIPAATCAHARAVLLAIITGRKTPAKGAATDVMSELKQTLRARG